VLLGRDVAQQRGAEAANRRSADRAAGRGRRGEGRGWAGGGVEDRRGGRAGGRAGTGPHASGGAERRRVKQGPRSDPGGTPAEGGASRCDVVVGGRDVGRQRAERVEGRLAGGREREGRGARRAFRWGRTGSKDVAGWPRRSTQSPPSAGLASLRNGPTHPAPHLHQSSCLSMFSGILFSGTWPGPSFMTCRKERWGLAGLAKVRWQGLGRWAGLGGSERRRGPPAQAPPPAPAPRGRPEARTPRRTCTLRSHARRVSSPCVLSSANCAASLASGGRDRKGGEGESRGAWAGSGLVGGLKRPVGPCCCKRAGEKAACPWRTHPRCSRGAGRRLWRWHQREGGRGGRLARQAGTSERAATPHERWAGPTPLGPKDADSNRSHGSGPRAHPASSRTTAKSSGAPPIESVMSYWAQMSRISSQCSYAKFSLGWGCGGAGVGPGSLIGGGDRTGMRPRC
jgi:hypothetical protein